ncbi:WD repeat protein [Arthroderma uncinatum]|uniref:WD repeat protein n=1 Tax=Arthroderma uncinatum TaxID=74035 RepID=UPI00144AB745|nr:WD repeat protein [Arthroderma uncinatum]KAF3482917.1 WD repeat protein [Arthroderma uncinatum]
MFDTVCSYPLPADIFTQAIHPTEPIVSVGLSSGHVETFKLPAEHGSDPGEHKNGLGHIDTIWKTRRHKGSCRSLAFGIDGEMLYSAGTDGWVKAAKSETGRVVTKFAVPRPKESALHIFDLRAPSTEVSARPEQTHYPHDDYISSLTPLPPSEMSTSGFSKQWITTGGTTIAVTDLRRGVMVRSEDQGEELTSSTYVTGLKAGGTSKGEKLVVGGASGIVTLWEKGAWDDQDERITVDRSPLGGESLEVLANVPDEISNGKVVVAGLGDGRLKFIQLGSNSIISETRHDEVEGVAGLGFDIGGRMVSSGGSIVKVWHEAPGNGSGQDNWASSSKRHFEDSDDDDDDEADSDQEDAPESDEGEKEDKKRKKRKRGKGKDRTGGQHVMAFKDLD